METIERWLLNPIPRGATYREWADFHITPRILYAHQLFYVFKGKGNGMLGEESFPLEPGLLVIYGPGCTHSFKSIGRGGIEMGMVCFSLNETSAEKRALGNGYVTAIDETYWEKADVPVCIEGLPPFPIRINISNFAWRWEFEELLKTAGEAWRIRFTEPQVYQVKSLLLFLFFHLEKEFQRLSACSSEPPIVHRIVDCIRSHSSEGINRQQVARKLGISDSYMTSLLKRYRQTNFSEFLENTRMAVAREYLQYSDMNEAQIADAAGFFSVSYFITRFKKKYGLTPRDFRNGIIRATDNLQN